MKEGKKTTEFYLTIAVSALGILTATGLITPEQSSTLTTSLTQIVGAVVAGFASFGYSISRGMAKKNNTG